MRTGRCGRSHSQVILCVTRGTHIVANIPTRGSMDDRLLLSYIWAVCMRENIEFRFSIVCRQARNVIRCYYTMMYSTDEPRMWICWRRLCYLIQFESSQSQNALTIIQIKFSFLNAITLSSTFFPLRPSLLRCWWCCWYCRRVILIREVIVTVSRRTWFVPKNVCHLIYVRYYANVYTPILYSLVYLHKVQRVYTQDPWLSTLRRSR